MNRVMDTIIQSAHPNNAVEHPDIKFPITQAKRSSTEKMRALVWHGTCDVRVEEVPKVQITEPTDALVKMVATTVCGSDLHLYHGEFAQLEKGDILGHEGVGIIVEVGPEVRNFKVGDRVTVSAVISCGKCEFCKRSEFSFCENTNPSKDMEKIYGHRTAGLFGYTSMLGHYEGLQAEFMRVPIADVNMLKLPAEVSDEMGVFMSDILSTSLHAVTRAGVKRGDTVAIWGAGPIGMLCAVWAKDKGAARVIVIDDVPFRLKMAKESAGADDVINFGEEKVVDRMQQLVHGGPDVCIDAAGFRYTHNMLHTITRALRLETDTPEVANQCITCVKKGGTVCLIADYIAYCNGFAIGPLMEKGVTLVGGGQLFCQKYWKESMEALAQKRIDPSFMVTHQIPFAEMSETYKRFDAKEAGMMKVIVRP